MGELASGMAFYVRKNGEPRERFEAASRSREHVLPTMTCDEEDALGFQRKRVSRAARKFRPLFRVYIARAGCAGIELCVAVRAGSIDEADGERGIAHMIEHLAFREDAAPF